MSSPIESLNNKGFFALLIWKTNKTPRHQLLNHENRNVVQVFLEKKRICHPKKTKRMFDIYWAFVGFVFWVGSATKEIFKGKSVVGET